MILKAPESVNFRRRYPPRRHPRRRRSTGAVWPHSSIVIVQIAATTVAVGAATLFCSSKLLCSCASLATMSPDRGSSSTSMTLSGKIFFLISLVVISRLLRKASREENWSYHVRYIHLLKLKDPFCSVQRSCNTITPAVSDFICPFYV